MFHTQPGLGLVTGGADEGRNPSVSRRDGDVVAFLLHALLSNLTLAGSAEMLRGTP